MSWGEVTSGKPPAAPRAGDSCSRPPSLRLRNADEVLASENDLLGGVYDSTTTDGKCHSVGSGPLPALEAAIKVPQKNTPRLGRRRDAVGTHQVFKEASPESGKVRVEQGQQQSSLESYDGQGSAGEEDAAEGHKRGEGAAVCGVGQGCGCGSGCGCG